MTIRYQVCITDDAGTVVAIPRDYGSCKYTLRADGGIGMCEIILPRRKYQAIMDEANPDYRIQIWRSVDGGATYRLDGHTEYFALQWEKTDDAIRVTAPSIQHLLTRRINAFYAGYQDTVTRIGSIYSGAVTTIMYDLINANFAGGMIDPNRDVIGVFIPNLTINGPLGLGPSLNVACTRENVFDTLNKFAEASINAGRWAAGIVSSNGNQWEFNAYVDWVGVDRRNTLLLSPEARNIQNATLTINAIDQKSAVIAAGRGTGQGRYINIQQASTVIAQSLYGYKESFVEDTNARTSQMAALARSELRKLRQTVDFTCDLTQHFGTVRGVHYDVGDFLRIRYLDRMINVRLDMVEVSLTNGASTESARLSI